MVKLNLKKIMLSILGVVAIMGVLKFTLVETNWVRCIRIIDNRRLEYRETVKPEEVDMLLKKWPIFKQTSFANDLVVSYHTESLSKDLSLFKRIWFVYHLIDIDRFLYVQQRVLAMLNYLEVRRSAQAIIKKLSSRRNDPLAIEMMRVQKGRLAAESYGKDELKLIQDKEDLLKQLFKQYP